MNNQEYLEFTRTTAIYPKDKELEYVVLGLANEAGEVAGKVKKVLRGDRSFNEAKSDIFAESSDVLWYLARLCDCLGFTLDELIEYNYQKLSGRKERNTLRGDGDNR